MFTGNLYLVKISDKPLNAGEIKKNRDARHSGAPIEGVRRWAGGAVRGDWGPPPFYRPGETDFFDGERKGTPNP